MIFYANCKINIGLDVVGRRADGYHDIETLMFPVRGLADVVEVLKSSDDGCRFTASGLAVDCPPSENICLKAYELMRERYSIGGVNMHLHKVVPFGAGLGGGSSDGAEVIRGLSMLFELGLGLEEMEGLASEIGSDTAFFIRKQAAMASGRGEILQPYSIDLAGKWIAVLKPQGGVSTAQAYSGVVVSAPAVPLGDRLAEPIAKWNGTVTNAFEPHIITAYPEIGLLKQFLYDSGAIYASMSGSGSAVYGIFDSKPELPDLPPDTFLHREQVVLKITNLMAV